MGRLFQVVSCLVLLLCLLVPMVVIGVIIRLTSPGPAIHWSRRVGKGNKPFLMPKFRTMHMSTPDVATHLLGEPGQHITAVGRILRKFSVDELPQIYSILNGDMNFIGPRPALWNQSDLIGLRTEAGVIELKPGVTGWAQVNGRDNLTLTEKVAQDVFYLNERGFRLDALIVVRSVYKVLSRADVKH